MTGSGRWVGGGGGEKELRVGGGWGWEGGLEEGDKYNKKYILVQMRGRFSCSENQKHGLVVQILLAGLRQSLTLLSLLFHSIMPRFFLYHSKSYLW